MRGNAATVAINSHVVLPIVKECVRLEPDLVIVYLGNNEVVGPYGPGTVFRPASGSLWAVRAGIALRASARGRGLATLLMQFLHGAARRRGARILFAAVPSDLCGNLNEPFHRTGFVHHGRLLDYFAPNIHQELGSLQLR